MDADKTVLAHFIYEMMIKSPLLSQQAFAIVSD